ncbi:MAG: hypothetical protein Q4A09_04510 [Capnocytophaga felis]|nr:hypothetical protein [Capnocytophaga felis]
MLQEMMETPEKWSAFVRLSKRLSFEEEALSKLRFEIIRKWKALNVEKWRVIHLYKNLLIRFQIGYDDNGVNITLSFDSEYEYDFMVTTYWGISEKKLIQWKRENPEKTEKIVGLLPYKHSCEEIFCRDSLSFHDGKQIISIMDQNKMSWYAYNQTEEFADQMIEKILKIQTPEMTAIFEEINEKCKA